MSDDPEDPIEPPPLVQMQAPSPPSPEQHRAALEDQMEWDRLDAEDQSKKLHAMFCNRIFIQPDGLHLRITFGEKVGEESVYHSTIMVPNGDALAFGKLLVNMAQASLDNQIAFYRLALAEVDAEAAEQGTGGGAEG